MTATSGELLLSALEVIGYGVGSLLLSGLGVYIEENALTAIAAGRLGLGMWMVFMGVIGLYAGYMIATDRFYGAYCELRSTTSG
ncbi:MAG: hypothetical protein ABEH35_07455 [Haloarculaceae archaeon]